MPFGLGRKKAHATVDRQRQVDLGYAARLLAEGNLSLMVDCNIDSSISLTLRNISLMEPLVTHTDAGIKEKIARGLYFYVAQPRIEPSVELIEVDRGTLTITVDGIVFAGKSRHIAAGFGAIESISHSQNGISIVTGNSAQRLYFDGVDRVILPLKVHDREYRQPLSGKLMRLLVEAVIKISFEGRNGA